MVIIIDRFLMFMNLRNIPMLRIKEIFLDQGNKSKSNFNARDTVRRDRLNGGIVIKIDDTKRAVIRFIDGSDGCY